MAPSKWLNSPQICVSIGSPYSHITLLDLLLEAGEVLVLGVDFVLRIGPGWCMLLSYVARLGYVVSIDTCTYDIGVEMTGCL